MSYTVLLIDNNTKLIKEKIDFETLIEAKLYILDILEMMIEPNINWYKKNGSKSLKKYEKELDETLKVQPFDIYQIIKN